MLVQAFTGRDCVDAIHDESASYQSCMCTSMGSFRSVSAHYFCCGKGSRGLYLAEAFASPERTLLPGRQPALTLYLIIPDLCHEHRVLRTKQDLLHSETKQVIRCLLMECLLFKI